MLRRINQSLGRLSRSEKRVAEWVLAHPRQATESTVAAVAQACATSEPSVIRFCRRIGLSGFRELTIRLTEALSQPVSLVHHDVSPQDSTSDATVKVVEATIQSLVDLRAALSGMPFDTVVARMMQARQFVFAGLGASGHVASDACHKFFRLGTPCSALIEPPSIRQFAAIADERDVLLMVSKNGDSRDLCEAAREARENGALVVAITDPESPLAHAASETFACDAHEDTNIYTPRSSRLVHLALLDALHVATALASGDAAAQNLSRSKDALSPTA
ncbi:MAG: SIS domain-containing protein [Gammaproteobacteria bacterium]|nr:SIS domain-containing protein [Gammaproteobacteria bacterium]MBT8094544.1 SIS domain-containing protein [Gammaproteobacteria bacterium]MBT8104820.1 SIS domain-containing protein [Gammaproteobacteria bacterium]NNF49974.1 SIS domain-containing protein [Woeseiaceae bacterium]NNK24834.1 SIS domain-containing protein [Woeseiaceae bacterium]